MSVQEIQNQHEKLTPEELAEVEKHIRILRVISAPGYKERIAEAHRRMDSGKKVMAGTFEAKLGRDADADSAR